MSDLLVAFITATSVLSDVSGAQKEEVVAFMQKRGYDSMSWDKIRYASKMSPKNTQNWDEPGLVEDLLAATVNHLNPSKQDILQIANKAKAMGGWQFTEGAC
ncbi:hypothetical protein INS49_011717 [Diaporthe citri]|uniref:uncharacterized protein n=1 Tax=Diaporthe citri TaxID=83186 RepID=UPI001C7F0889|nr:uncharacterized protein INS49_011717 [Diaporthe citri]KAG6360652.1 hypothetical protein INS49_011717 [Diaporthe citri]